ncbi:MAG TPA: hypothetical protein VEK15_12815 [Vicinamibacteria bacterium]|nr:hypothetical protein [Vicinamibacteria bacterium]
MWSRRSFLRMTGAFGATSLAARALGLQEVAIASASVADRSADEVDAGDVGVIERGEELRLALEAGEALSVLGERRREHLDRHFEAEPWGWLRVEIAFASRSKRREESRGDRLLALGRLFLREPSGEKPDRNQDFNPWIFRLAPANTSTGRSWGRGCPTGLRGVW